eukprot:s1257_g12.t1
MPSPTESASAADTQEPERERSRERGRPEGTETGGTERVGTTSRQRTVPASSSAADRAVDNSRLETLENQLLQLSGMVSRLLLSQSSGSAPPMPPSFQGPTLGENVQGTGTVREGTCPPGTPTQPVGPPADPDPFGPALEGTAQQVQGRLENSPPSIHVSSQGQGQQGTALGGDDNPFRRSEKWMPSVPSPEHTKWKSRPQEVEGFQQWVFALATWAGCGSNEYPREILYSVKHATAISWGNFSSAMITRSIRLLSIVKDAFQDHARASLIISNYEESLGRVNACGYEALRPLAREFSVKTRAEMLFFRRRVTEGSFKGATIPETVRMIEAELFKYNRLKEITDPSVNMKDLDIHEPDKVLLLLRCLPEPCRQHLTLFVPDESFSSYCAAALKYESQQRAWTELNSKPIANMNEKGFEKGTGKSKGKKGKGKDSNGKGSKGKQNESKGTGKQSGKGEQKETRTCFQCGERGHLAGKCPQKKTKGAKGEKGNSKGKNKGNGKKSFSKGKGKRATELSDAEAEPGAEPSEGGDGWSELEYDGEAGGRLSCCFGPSFLQPCFQKVQFGPVLPSCFEKQPLKPRLKHHCIPWFLLWIVSVFSMLFLAANFWKWKPNFVDPFLVSSYVHNSEPQYWLVDSGASRTVIAESAVSQYKSLKERTLAEPLLFHTADAGEVRVSHQRGAMNADFRNQLDERTEPIVQADFFYVTVRDHNSGTAHCWQYIALVESMTGMIGCSYLHDNVDKTVANMTRFFSALGVSHEMQIDCKVDAEKGLETLLKRLPFRLRINHAAPQAHQSVGACERTVRRFKESCACIRSDMRSNGIDLQPTSKAFESLFFYVVQTHNHFNVGGDEQNSRRSPHQLVVQRDSAMPLCSVFGSVVFAKVTDALKEKVEEGTRYIPAAYLFPSFGHQAHELSTMLNSEIYTFRSEIKLLDKITWETTFAPDVTKRITPNSKSDYGKAETTPQDSDVGLTEVLHFPPQVPQPAQPSGPAAVGDDRMDVRDDETTYTPSLAPDDVDMADVEQDDVEGQQMDISALTSRLTPPPEECIDFATPCGILFPIFVPKTGEKLSSEEFQLCNQKVFLIRPTSAVSEDGESVFSVQQAKDGRRTELQAMHDLKFGKIIGREAATMLAKKYNCKIIPCRWVITEKVVQVGDATETICRARCVAQQVAAHETSASNLGISSNTPTLESFRSMIALAADCDLFVGCLDISTAFLNSELPRTRQVVKLPADVSMKPDEYEPTFVDLTSALNGLRVASNSWMLLANKLLGAVGLTNNRADPCVFAGMIYGKPDLACCVMIYVDDLLVIGRTEKCVHLIKEALARKVKTKLTGLLSDSSGDGGRITCLGRKITRHKGDTRLFMRIDPQYLQPVFTEFDVKATMVPPNIATELETGCGSFR